MADVIAGVAIPDSTLARSATEMIRDTTNELIYHHSRRVFLFGSLQSQRLGIEPDPELLYVAALFHDTGLVEPYRTSHQRFEMDGADAAVDFLVSQKHSAAEAHTVWTAIALHTTPQVPYKMDPVVAATTAGVETDVLGVHLDAIGGAHLAAVTSAHPRPNFKAEILRAFADGFATRPDTTFGTVNADVLRHFDPSFEPIDFVSLINESGWAE
ncbi:MAG: HD domain-containing protein [Mycobacterium sp.]